MGRFDSDIKRLEAIFLRWGIHHPVEMLAHTGAYLVQAVGKRFGSEMPPMPPLPDVPAELKTELAFLDRRGFGRDRVTPFYRDCIMRMAPRSESGGYPIPRHLARALGSLVGTEGKTAADWACVSGSLLAECKQAAVGAGRHPAWVMVARANLWLNRKAPGIEVAGADEASRTWAGECDVVVSNLHDDKQPLESLRASYASLTPGGRAALILPGALLSSYEPIWKEARSYLLKTKGLEALVSLPSHVLQPFVEPKEPPALVFLRRPAHEQFVQPPLFDLTRSFWVVQLLRDGYTEGRGRDLTVEPKGINDLPALPLLVGPGRNPTVPVAGIEPPVTFRMLQGREGREPVRGVVLSPSYPWGIGTIKSVWLPNEQRGLIIGLETVHGETGPRILVHPDEGARRDDELDTRFQRAPILYEGRGPRDAGVPVAILLDGSVIGIELAPGQFIDDEDWILTPSLVLSQAAPPVPQVSTADLLKQIRQDQRQLVRHVDRLLAKLELHGSSDKPFPLAVAKVPPLPPLSTKQEAVWKLVREQVEKDGRHKVPRPFGWSEVQPKGMDRSSVEQTLALFEQMGLIVAIVINGLGGYRLVSQADVVPARRGNRS